MRIYKIVRNPKISNTVVGLAFRDKYKGFSFYHFLVYSIVLVHWTWSIAMIFHINATNLVASVSGEDDGEQGEKEEEKEDAEDQGDCSGQVVANGATRLEDEYVIHTLHFENACLFSKFCACKILVLIFALVVAQYCLLTHGYAVSFFNFK